MCWCRRGWGGGGGEEGERGERGREGGREGGGGEREECLKRQEYGNRTNTYIVKWRYG